MHLHRVEAEDLCAPLGERIQSSCRERPRRVRHESPVPGLIQLRKRARHARDFIHSCVKTDTKG